jgi:hypothetical protein
VLFAMSSNRLEIRRWYDESESIDVVPVLTRYLALKEKTSAASWLSVGLFPLNIFLLLSYLVLPEKWTLRHYINICLTLSVCCIQVSHLTCCHVSDYLTLV